MAELHDWVPYGDSPTNEWACWRCGWKSTAERAVGGGLCPGPHWLAKGPPEVLRVEIDGPDLTALRRVVGEDVGGWPGAVQTVDALERLAPRGLVRWVCDGAGGLVARATEAGRWQLHLRGLLTGAPTPSTAWIKPGVVMRHHSGRLYEVLDVSNIDTTDPVKFPVTAHYRGTNDKTWSRSIASMAGKFTLAPIGASLNFTPCPLRATVRFVRNTPFSLEPDAPKSRLQKGDVRWRRDTGLRFDVKHVSPGRGQDEPLVLMRSVAGTTWSGPANRVSREFTDVRPFERGDQVWHRKSDRNYTVESIESGGPNPIAVLRSRCGRVWQGPIDSAFQAFQDADPPAGLQFDVGDTLWRRSDGLRCAVTRIQGVAHLPESEVTLDFGGRPRWVGPASKVSRQFTDVEPAKLGTLYWRRDTGRRYVLTDRKANDTVVLVRDDWIRWTGPERQVTELFVDRAPDHWVGRLGSNLSTPMWGPGNGAERKLDTALSEMVEACETARTHFGLDVATRSDGSAGATVGRDGVEAIVPLAPKQPLGWVRRVAAPGDAGPEPLLDALDNLRDGKWFGIVGVQQAARDAAAAIRQRGAEVLDLRCRLSTEQKDAGGARVEARRAQAKADRLLSLARTRADELQATHNDLKTAREKQAALAAELESMRGRKDDAYTERNHVVAALARVLHAVGWSVSVTETDIPDWDPQWHGCVYIDGPSGQLSWHFHDDDAWMFRGLPHRPALYDGHTPKTKYVRLDHVGRGDVVLNGPTAGLVPDVERHLSAIAGELAVLRRRQAQADARSSGRVS